MSFPIANRNAIASQILNDVVGCGPCLRTVADKNVVAVSDCGGPRFEMRHESRRREPLRSGAFGDADDDLTASIPRDAVRDYSLLLDDQELLSQRKRQRSLEMVPCRRHQQLLRRRVSDPTAKGQDDSSMTSRHRILRWRKAEGLAEEQT